MLTLETWRPPPAGTVGSNAGVRVAHSHHYHAALLRTLYEAEGIDAVALLGAAAHAAAGVLDRSPGAPATRGDVAAYLEECGLGRADLSGVNDEGMGAARIVDSHFAVAWTRRFRRSNHPVCAATGALLASLLGRVYGRSLSATETACAATGAAACTFEITVAEGTAPESGRLRQTGGTGHPGTRLLTLGPVDGRLEGPGAPFTRLPPEFYAALAQSFQVEVPTARGAKFSNLPGILLQEAAHRNGYFLFGEILCSEAWKERSEAGEMEPLARLEALLEVVERLGWGSWEVTSFVASERLIVRVPDSYEALAHASLFGRAPAPRCAIARGAAAAIMNLLFRAEETARSAPSEAGYNQLFRSPASFRAVETRCRAMGDTFCEIVANPLSL